MKETLGGAIATGVIFGIASYGVASYVENRADTTPYTSYLPQPTASSTPKTSISKVEANKKLVVVIDPGHGPNKNAPLDTKTGYDLNDWRNPIETDEVWGVAQTVKNLLEPKYDVRFTKKELNEPLTFRDRVERAATAQAALVVSIHTDHTTPSMQWVTPQKTGLSRGAAPKTVTAFTDSKLACVSAAYAESIRAQRQKALRSPVILHDLNFTARNGSIAPGTISWVQLLAGEEGIPWVYNEFGGDKDVPLTRDQLGKYATGIANGIDAALTEQQKTLTRCGA